MTLHDYHQLARTWLDAASHAMRNDLASDTVYAAHRLVGDRFRLDSADSKVVVAAALAAGYLAEKTDADDLEYADVVRDAAHALLQPTASLTDKLALGRQFAVVAPTDKSPHRELATCLRKSGAEYVAACGQLVRAVIGVYKDQALLRAAWIELYAKAALQHLAQAAPQMKGLAVAAVEPRGRHRKTDIAAAASISRPTLDRWISETDQAGTTI